MNIITRKENILKNNVLQSAISIEINPPFFFSSIVEIIVTISLDDLKNINYWTIPSIFLKERIKNYKLISNYAELKSMDIFDIPKASKTVKVARLKYEIKIKEIKDKITPTHIWSSGVYTNHTTTALNSDYISRPTTTVLTSDYTSRPTTTYTSRPSFI